MKAMMTLMTNFEFASEALFLYTLLSGSQRNSLTEGKRETFHSEIQRLEHSVNHSGPANDKSESAN
jgi:hypothetical protein